MYKVIQISFYLENFIGYYKIGHSFWCRKFSTCLAEICMIVAETARLDDLEHDEDSLVWKIIGNAANDECDEWCSPDYRSAWYLFNGVRFSIIFCAKCRHLKIMDMK
jgi:hypothetical protein